MKTLLVTIAIGEKYLQEYYMLFYNSQRNYAIKNGYDFKVITDFLDKNNKYKTTISFNKILVCNQEWSREYDFIVFVDADILININSPPIHNYIDYGKNIGIVNEYSQPTKERRIMIQKHMGWESSAKDYYKLSGFDIQTDMVLNSGVLVMQPKIHNELLINIYNNYVETSRSHSRGYHYEQSCIGYELQKNKKFIILNNKFNSLWPIAKIDNKKTLQEYYNNNYFIHFAGKTDFHLIHFLE